MPKRQVYSSKGDLVDFDLLEITANLSSMPQPTTVNKRKQFIDDKEKNKIIKGIPLSKLSKEEQEAYIKKNQKKNVQNGEDNVKTTT